MPKLIRPLALVAAGAAVAAGGAMLLPDGAGAITDVVGTGDSSGVLLFFAMYVLGGIVSVPPVIFVVAAGALWPFPTALSISLSGGIATAVLGFLMSRHVARDFCALHIPRRLRKYNDGVEKHGFKTTVVLRLLFFLFPPVNWMLGISRVRLRDYALGTALGSIPSMLVYTLIGHDWIPWILEEPFTRLAITLACLSVLVGSVLLIPRLLRARRVMGDLGPSISWGLFFRFARDYLYLSLETFFPPKPYRRPPPVKRCLIMVVFLPLFGALQFIHWMALFLDEILFPRYRTTPVDAPFFIVGVPRSGTTHLHRVLSRDTDQFTTLQLWHVLLAPAITERKLLHALARLDRKVGRPLGRLITRISDKVTGDLSDIHALALKQPEEDFLLLMPVLACFILTAVFPHSKLVTDLCRFDTCVAESRRREVLAFYRGLLQRHLFCSGNGRTLLSKNVSFTPMLFSLAETFPDANFVTCIRDPLKTVPSQISAMEQGWQAFGNSTESPLFRDRWVDLVEYYCRHLNNVLDSSVGDRVECVEMGMLKSDLTDTVARLYERFGLVLNGDFSERLEEEERLASQFSSRHAYALESYGLDADELKERFRPHWQRLQKRVYAGNTV